MSALLAPHAPLRVFALSALLTVAVIIGVLLGMGLEAMLLVTVLIAVEITFSFENAVINARILAQLSAFWQQVFLTVGIVIAIFGMRVVFPIAIVALTAHLPWSTVVDLAFNHPETYAHKLESAHPAIAAFGGMFLLMLALYFFFDDKRPIVWIKQIEERLQRVHRLWGAPLVALAVITVLAIIPANDHVSATLVAGSLGVAAYLFIQAISAYVGSLQPQRELLTKQTGLAAFTSFLYLEMLDASFSFDGVIGAFAVTTDVVLIALGLGVGAIWVRSMTVFMVHRGTLAKYVYLEHGAHYTVAVLAVVMLLSLFVDVPEVIAGIAGLGLLGSAIVASRNANQKAHASGVSL